MAEETTLVIVSSHAVLRECLAFSLSKLGRFEVEQYDGSTRRQPTVYDPESTLLLVDLCHRPPDLINWLSDLRHRLPVMRMILLGVNPEPDSRDARFLGLNAEGSLPIDASLSEMVEAIDQVLDGEKFYPPSIAFLLYQRLAEISRQQDLRRRLSALILTPRELEILRLIAVQCSNEEIASRLGISIHTVKNHVHNILEKLEVENRNTAAEVALSRGWLETSHPLGNSPSPRGL